MHIRPLTRHLVVLLVATLLTPGSSYAATFSFGNDQNGITNLPSASLSTGGITMDMIAQPSGAVFNDTGSAGMGIVSRSIAGVFDPNIDKFDVLLDDNQDPLFAESLKFSFNRRGVLTGINFDGVKDESLEYFILTDASGVRISFFDSAANESVSGAVDEAVSSGAVTGDVVYLLEIDAAIDDEARGLSIPFVAGGEFTLTYAELGAEFNPLEPGNGSRLQGITVAPIPEPAAHLLAVVGAVLCALRRRWRR